MTHTFEMPKSYPVRVFIDWYTNDGTLESNEMNPYD